MKTVGWISQPCPVSHCSSAVASVPVAARGAGRIVFATFAAFAEAEREFIRDRTLDGLDTAEANGRFGGRPRALDDDDLAVARDRRRRIPPQSVIAIARDLGVGRSTLYRALAEDQEDDAE